MKIYRNFKELNFGNINIYYTTLRCFDITILVLNTVKALIVFRNFKMNKIR